jgi:hypothetical protein
MTFFRGGGGEAAQPLCRVLGTDGTEFVAQQVGLSGEHLEQVELVGVSGVRWSTWTDRIDAFDFSAMRVVYLSDLAAEKEEWRPYVQIPATAESILALGRPHRDRGIGTGPLELGGQRCRKGLALRSRSELVFRLPGPFQRFAALVGIDDTMAGRGHVKLVISGDGKTLYDEVLAGGQSPKSIDLDITGIRLLTLLVDYGEALDWSDRVILCNARIVR